MQDLERKGLVGAGTAAHWFNQVENSPYLTDGYHGMPDQGESSAMGAAGGSSTAEPEWVWDEARQEYRYWDSTAQRWVWASEIQQ